MSRLESMMQPQWGSHVEPEADGVWVRWDDIDPKVRRRQYLIERNDPDSVFVGSLGIVDLFGMRAVCVKPGTPLMGGRIASAETALFSDPVSDARTNPLDNLNMIHSDVRDILLVLGLGDHARPISMHEVVRQEIIPAIERMRQRLEGAEGGDRRIIHRYRDPDTGHRVTSILCERHDAEVLEWLRQRGVGSGACDAPDSLPLLECDRCEDEAERADVTVVPTENIEKEKAS